MSNLDNIYDNELINQYRQRNNILRRTLQNTRRRMLRCQEDLNKARNPTAGTGSTQGGGKRKNKSRKMKGGFMTLTADFVKNNFDHFAENGIEIEIEIEGRRQKIIIHKNLHPDTDQPIDYTTTNGTFFLYTFSQSSEANQLVAFVDLTEYNPGDVKINISNPQSGSGRKKRKKKSRKMKGGHHLYKRLGVSKYASQKQIRKAYNKLKKKKRVTSKIKHAYNILSKKKSRRKYNLRYKTRKH